MAALLNSLISLLLLFAIIGLQSNALRIVKRQTNDETIKVPGADPIIIAETPKNESTNVINTDQVMRKKTPVPSKYTKSKELNDQIALETNEPNDDNGLPLRPIPNDSKFDRNVNIEIANENKNVERIDNKKFDSDEETVKTVLKEDIYPKVDSNKPDKIFDHQEDIDNPKSRLHIIGSLNSSQTVNTANEINVDTHDDQRSNKEKEKIKPHNRVENGKSYNESPEYQNLVFDKGPDDANEKTHENNLDNKKETAEKNITTDDIEEENHVEYKSEELAQETYKQDQESKPITSSNEDDDGDANQKNKVKKNKEDKDYKIRYHLKRNHSDVERSNNAISPRTDDEKPSRVRISLKKQAMLENNANSATVSPTRDEQRLTVQLKQYNPGLTVSSSNVNPVDLENNLMDKEKETDGITMKRGSTRYMDTITIKPDLESTSKNESKEVNSSHFQTSESPLVITTGKFDESARNDDVFPKIEETKYDEGSLNNVIKNMDTHSNINSNINTINTISNNVNNQFQPINKTNTVISGGRVDPREGLLNIFTKQQELPTSYLSKLMKLKTSTNAYSKFMLESNENNGNSNTTENDEVSMERTTAAGLDEVLETTEALTTVKTVIYTDANNENNKENESSEDTKAPTDETVTSMTSTVTYEETETEKKLNEEADKDETNTTNLPLTESTDYISPTTYRPPQYTRKLEGSKVSETATIVPVTTKMIETTKSIETSEQSEIQTKSSGKDTTIISVSTTTEIMTKTKPIDTETTPISTSEWLFDYFDKFDVAETNENKTSDSSTTTTKTDDTTKSQPTKATIFPTFDTSILELESTSGYQSDTSNTDFFVGFSSEDEEPKGSTAFGGYVKESSKEKTETPEMSAEKTNKAKETSTIVNTTPSLEKAINKFVFGTGSSSTTPSDLSDFSFFDNFDNFNESESNIEFDLEKDTTTKASKESHTTKIPKTNPDAKSILDVLFQPSTKPSLEGEEVKDDLSNSLSDILLSTKIFGFTEHIGRGTTEEPLRIDLNNMNNVNAEGGKFEDTDGNMDGVEDDQDGENTTAIAAAIIFGIAVICLILLVLLLFIVRKRQQRLTYGQRCTPVSLDAYSLDSVSVCNNSVRKRNRASKRSYRNAAFDDPDSASNSLAFPALSNFARDTEAIEKEYNQIPQVAVHTNEIPVGCEDKNRYANVIPLPETRVVLSRLEGNPHSDYINANFVHGFKNAKNYYIATQAPLANTVDDFWRMVWEKNSRIILMLTNLVESGVEKCVDYLPPSEVIDCNRQFGNFQVTLKKREVKEKYVISSLELKDMVSNSWREITHLWYLDWPDRGVPPETSSIIAFIIEARSYLKTTTKTSETIDTTEASSSYGNADKNHAPIVIHCSPGTGRTGCVIACDIAIREFELTRQVDIPRTVYRIRRDRAGAIQTKEQYTFIYKVLNHYATKLTGGSLDSF